MTWIWIKDFDDSVNPGKFLLFWKTFGLDRVPLGEHIVRDTRYRMLANGRRAAFGPCKSYLYFLYNLYKPGIAGKAIIKERGNKIP